ncbi:hypothetical protein AVEN_33021-1 [Araneus ventricosus]|uniref:Reverse transcriptase domain-containing protein n=1 Tax=Araneus ventricosus TaxID=182803 RepID=A0A4Y2NBK8_ARAVE|nr:hypothetical protein AVEN_33021-1 [Araneus ventricosus]
MNNKFYTGGVFLDIQKAFDRMGHDGLIYKLIQLNFPKYLINILRSFLENGTFKVIIHGESSNTGVIKAGTPQGSVQFSLQISLPTQESSPASSQMTQQSSLKARQSITSYEPFNLSLIPWKNG